MKGDRRGGMGFAEAMLAVMTVSIVLMMYIGTVSTAALSEPDPLNGFDTDMVSAEVVGGKVVIGPSEYLDRFVSERDGCGVTMSVTVPGGFADGPAVRSSGTAEGSSSSVSFSKNIPADHGRTVSAVFGVTLWY